MVCVTSVLACLVALPVWAESPPDPREFDASPSEQVERRLNTLSARLEIDKARASELMALKARFGPQRKELQSTKRKLFKELRALIEEDVSDEQAYQLKLDELMNVEASLFELSMEEQVALAELLSPKQQALLMKARHERKMKRRGHRGAGADRDQGQRGDGSRVRRSRRSHRVQ